MPVRPLAAAVLVLAACAPPPGAPLPERGALRAELVAQLDRSAEAWTRGDLEGFLSDYAADSATSFVAGGRVHRGLDWIRDHYAPSFRPNAPRDRLRFESFEVRPLAPTLALVTARFVLSRGDSVTASGPFTLVLERRAQEWKILHDHTSSDPR